MSNKQIQNLKDFVEICSTLEAAQMLKTAISTGIVSALNEGQKTSEEIAQHANLNARAVSALAECLVHIGLLEKYEPYFALSPAAKMLTEVSIGHEFWGQLENFVRTGSSISSQEELSGRIDSSPFALRQASGEWMRTPAAMDAVAALDIGKTRRGIRVLEVGCGSGIFSATLAHRDPDSTFVLFDNEANLIRAKKTVESINVQQQCELVECNDLSLPADQGGFDLVILTAQMHRRPESWCINWLQEVRSIMHVDGELALIDLFPGQENGELNLAFFHLQLMLGIENSQLHSAPRLQEILEENKFGRIQFAHLPSPPNYWGMILASRS